MTLSTDKVLGPIVKTLSRTDDVFNRITVFANRNPSTNSFENSALSNNETSQGLPWGIRDKDINARWFENQIDGLNATQALADFWRDRLSNKEVFYSINAWPSLAQLERGDVITLDLNDYGLFNVPAFVEAISSETKGIISLLLRAPDWTTVCYDFTDTSFIKTTQTELIGYLDGQKVFSIDVNGDFRTENFEHESLGALIGSGTEAAAYDETVGVLGSVFTIDFRKKGGIDHFMKVVLNKDLASPFIDPSETIVSLATDVALVTGVDLSGESAENRCVEFSTADDKTIFSIGATVVAVYDNVSSEFKLAGSILTGAL